MLVLQLKHSYIHLHTLLLSLRRSTFASNLISKMKRDSFSFPSRHQLVLCLSLQNKQLQIYFVTKGPRGYFLWQVFTFTIILVPYSAIVCPVDTYVEEYCHCKQKVLSCESSKVLASTIVPAPRVASGLPNLQDRSAEEMPCEGTQYHLGNPKQHHHRHHHLPHDRYYHDHNFLQCFEEMPCVGTWVPPG